MNGISLRDSVQRTIAEEYELVVWSESGQLIITVELVFERLIYG